MMPSRLLPARHVLKRTAVAVALLGVAALALSACDNTLTVVQSPTNTPAPAATSTTTTTTATATPGPSGYPVKVYFSKHPETDSNPASVAAVDRVSPTSGVATYAMQQLIAGPTGAEAAAGFYSELGAALTGDSNCTGADFQYTIDSASHIGTLRFCRQTQLAGDLVGPRISAQINATLKQFPNVTKVVILTRDGHCFDDLSGMDACLH